MVALEPEAATNAGDHERLDLGVAPLVEKNLEFLNDCLDDIVQEQQKARAPARRARAPARARARGRALPEGRRCGVLRKVAPLPRLCGLLGAA